MVAHTQRNYYLLSFEADRYHSPPPPPIMAAFVTGDEEVYTLTDNLDTHAILGGGSGSNSTAAPSRKHQLQGIFGGSKLHGLAKSHQWTKLLASATPELLYVLDEFNRTPLHYAIEQGCEEDEVLLELIRVGPWQVRVPDSEGESPVHLACDFGCSLVVAYALLEADVQHAKGRPSVLTMKNASQKTPLDLIRGHDTNKQSTETKKNRNAYGMSEFFETLSNLASSLTTLPWKYHRDDYEAVLAVFEEAAAGQTGVVGMAY